jgi:phosphatidylserine/phosphatidylglycerophosphate/cardiolipin synthase-like enzyme
MKRLLTTLKTPVLPLCILTFSCSLTKKVFAQPIRAYFTQSVDHTVSPLTDATQSVHLEDTICALINATDISLDIAVWDNGSDAIVAALNAAHNRGVIVRYITSSNSFNSALGNLSAAIPVVERNSGLTSNVMHNKFVVSDLTTVLMGSMNFGTGSMYDDYNNILLINDPALAQTYTSEFNEMWGSSGASPNLSLSKFGPDKTDNTTHQFTIGSTAVQSYFSPTDQTTAHIVEAINSADYTLDVALFTFTNNDLGDAVIAAKERGVSVRCIIENSNYIGSEYNGLMDAGIPTFSHNPLPNDFHHKYCIIDAFETGSDPQVVTGSHNWTNSAEDEYDENTLIVHDVVLAQQYSEEFFKRFVELGGVGMNENTLHLPVSFYPNPARETMFIKNPLQLKGELTVCTTSGVCVRQVSLIGSENALQITIPAGVYYLNFQTEMGNYRQMMVVD